jgi:hypothetical protein
MREWGVAALLNLEIGEMSGQIHILTALPLGEKSPWYQSNKKLGRTHRHSRSDFVTVSIKLSRLSTNVNK